MSFDLIDKIEYNCDEANVYSYFLNDTIISLIKRKTRSFVELT